MKNYYKILGIERSASGLEIKKAFRDLALKVHPDKNKDADAHKKFVEINEAFQILSDSTKKAKYDSLFDYYVLNNKQNDKPNEAAVEDVNKWAEEGKKTGERYANYEYGSFTSEVLGELIGSELVSAVFDGLGDFIEVAGDVLGDILSGID